MDRQQNIPEAIAARVSASPDAIALQSGDRTLTYGELQKRAERLARRLRSLGVAPGVTAGLCLDGSPAMVVGALGILKAGGAYLPLDPADPIDYLGFVLDAAQPAVMVTAPGNLERLAPGPWRRVALDDDGRCGARSGPRVPAIRLAPDSAACRLYDRGTKPRTLTHADLLERARWHQRAFAVIPADRATQLASVAAEAAAWELWPYLAAGASIHFPDAAARANPEALRDWLVAERITITCVAAPIAEPILTLPWPSGTALCALLTDAKAPGCDPAGRLPFVVFDNHGPNVFARGLDVPLRAAPTATMGPIGAEGGGRAEGTRALARRFSNSEPGNGDSAA